MSERQLSLHSGCGIAESLWISSEVTANGFPHFRLAREDKGCRYHECDMSESNNN